MANPEKDLEVLWQRHIPEGYGSKRGRGSTDRDVALVGLAGAVTAPLLKFRNELDKGDIVLIIARRPSLYENDESR